MRHIILIAVAALSTGCETAPKVLGQDEAEQLVRSTSDFQLCEALQLGMRDPNIADMAREEQSRRGLDCARYAQAIATQDAGRRQAAAQAFIGMQNRPVYQAPAYIPPRQVNCTSNRIGNQTYTNCQ